MKKLALIVSSLLFAAGAASAQVAHPSILGAPLSFTEKNPAAIQYGHSVVGLNYGTGTGDTVPSSTTTYDTSVTNLGGRFVGEMFGVALESNSFKIDKSPANTTRKITSTNIGLSWAMMDWLALGLAMDSETTANTGNTDTKESLTGLGADFMFADAIYLGLVYGPTKMDYGSGLTATPNTTRYGIGYTNDMKADFRVHAEYYADTLEAHSITVPVLGPLTFEARNKTGLTLELKMGMFGLGYNSETTKQGTNNDVKGSTISLAYVPEMGFAATLSSSTRDSGTGGDKFTTNVLGLAWMF